MSIKVVTMVDRIACAGGGERFALAVASKLDPSRFESTLCVTRPCPQDALDEARAGGLRVFELARSSRRSLQPWRRLARFLRDERIDVLHSHKFGSNVWGSLVARAASVPVFVAHEHSWSYEGDPLRIFLDRHLVGPRAQAVIAVSALDRQRMIERERLPAARVVLQPNGIAPVPPVDAGRLRVELGCGPETPIVGFVGRLSPEKRVDLLLEAFARLEVGSTAPLCAIVGSGPDEAHVRLLTTQLGIADRVRFLGHRDDALELVAGFDVAVLPSDREGCPLAVLEYMALGRAIVATRVGGVPDLVADGAQALLVDRGDSVQLAQAIDRLLADDGLRAALGASARDVQQADFDLDAVVRRIEQLYERLLGSPAHPLRFSAAEPVTAGRLP
jgi:glycosyltransferase involved in cell wall biosynthesis